MSKKINVGSVVYHRNPSCYLADIVRGPGSVLSIETVLGVDEAEVLWQNVNVKLRHRLDSLMTLSEKVDQVEQSYD